MIQDKKADSFKPGTTTKKYLYTIIGLRYIFLNLTRTYGVEAG